MSDALKAIGDRPSMVLSRPTIQVKLKKYSIERQQDGRIRVLRQTDRNSGFTSSLWEFLSHRIGEGTLSSRAARLEGALRSHAHGTAVQPERLVEATQSIGDAQAADTARPVSTDSAVAAPTASHGPQAGIAASTNDAPGTRRLMSERMVELAVRSNAPENLDDSQAGEYAAKLWTALARHLNALGGFGDAEPVEALRAAAILAETEQGFAALQALLKNAYEPVTPRKQEALRIYLQTHAVRVGNTPMALCVREAATVLLTDSFAGLSDDQVGVYWAWRQGFRDDNRGGRFDEVKRRLLDLPEWVDLAEKRGANPDVRWYLVPFMYVYDSVRTVFGAASPLSAMKHGFCNADAPLEAQRKQQLQSALGTALGTLATTMKRAAGVCDEAAIEAARPAAAVWLASAHEERRAPARETFASALAELAPSAHAEFAPPVDNDAVRQYIEEQSLGEWFDRNAESGALSTLLLRAATLEYWARVNAANPAAQLKLDDKARAAIARQALEWNGSRVGAERMEPNSARGRQFLTVAERRLKDAEQVDVESLAWMGGWLETLYKTAGSNGPGESMARFGRDVDTVKRLLPGGIVVAEDLNAAGLKSAIGQFLEVARPGNEVTFGSAQHKGFIASPGLSFECFAGVSIEPTLAYAKESAATVTVGASESGGGFVSVMRASGSDMAAGLAASASVGFGNSMVVGLSVGGKTGIAVGQKKKTAEGVTISLRGETVDGNPATGATSAQAIFDFFADARAGLTADRASARADRATQLWNRFARQFFERDVSVSLTQHNEAEINGRVYASGSAKGAIATGLLSAGPSARIQVAGTLTTHNTHRDKTGIAKTVTKSSGYTMQANLRATAAQSVPWKNDQLVGAAVDDYGLPSVPWPLQTSKILSQTGYRDVLRLHSRDGRMIAQASFREREFLSHAIFRSHVERTRAQWQTALGVEALTRSLQEVADVSNGWGKRYVARHRLTDAAAARVDELRALRETMRAAGRGDSQIAAFLVQQKREVKAVLDDDDSWACCGFYVSERKVAEVRRGSSWILDLGGTRSAIGTRRLAESQASPAAALQHTVSMPLGVPTRADGQADDVPVEAPNALLDKKRTAKTIRKWSDEVIAPLVTGKRDLSVEKRMNPCIVAGINDFCGMMADDARFIQPIVVQAA